MVWHQGRDRYVRLRVLKKSFLHLEEFHLISGIQNDPSTARVAVRVIFGIHTDNRELFHLAEQLTTSCYDFAQTVMLHHTALLGLAAQRNTRLIRTCGLLGEVEHPATTTPRTTTTLGEPPTSPVEGNEKFISMLTGDTRREWRKLEAAILETGMEPRILSSLRTCEAQRDIYSTGRGAGDTRAIISHAQGCRSWHVLGRAIDVVLYRDGKKIPTNDAYIQMGDLAKGLGWKWGGDFPGFPDMVHVEWHPGQTTEEACPDPADCEAIQAAALAFDYGEEEEGGVGDVIPWVLTAGILVAAGGGVWWVMRRAKA